MEALLNMFGGVLRRGGQSSEAAAASRFSIQNGTLTVQTESSGSFPIDPTSPFYAIYGKISSSGDKGWRLANNLIWVNGDTYPTVIKEDDFTPNAKSAQNIFRSRSGQKQVINPAPFSFQGLSLQFGDLLLTGFHSCSCPTRMQLVLGSPSNNNHLCSWTLGESGFGLWKSEKDPGMTKRWIVIARRGVPLLEKTLPDLTQKKMASIGRSRYPILYRMENDQSFADVTVIFDRDHSIRAHKAVIAASSPVLKVQLEATSVLDLSTYRCAKDIIEWMYGDDLIVDSTTIVEVIHCAVKWRLTDLLSALPKVIKAHGDHIISDVNLALDIFNATSDEKIRQRICKFAQKHYQKEMTESFISQHSKFVSAILALERQ